MPANFDLGRERLLARAAVTERENVQPLESSTFWLRTERPPRLIVSVTLPEQPWACVTFGRELTLPVIVRLTLPPLSAFLAT